MPELTRLPAHFQRKAVSNTFGIVPAAGICREFENLRTSRTRPPVRNRRTVSCQC
jgi:hypothetical protein